MGINFLEISAIGIYAIRKLRQANFTLSGYFQVTKNFADSFFE